METTSRPYRYRQNATMRALYEAREIAAEQMMLETISIREAIRPIAARRLCRATATRYGA